MQIQLRVKTINLMCTLYNLSRFMILKQMRMFLLKIEKLLTNDCHEEGIQYY